ncbi:PREDICTED: protein CHLOROPLAST IMPORT APPARATUS 2-like [Camelina sativa]|uniref:Protein CHLOROPLAST IMPORT APPARATUS 2-like n=1 Tax=Camelina sativa TaxID=90675 RepID=A0ABM0UBQ6_CAMSA|nr:PREDICTED: protein CHLOROPLAST IMPORT APPARATUS 2-like [Camelina sativa]
MSSCLSGGAAYMVKSPPSHNTPSPSSTISESNSPPFLISTRRPRTPRKRPNQTYDEAAALLSTAYPNIFSSKKSKTHTFGSTKSPLSDYDEASQLLLPFDSIEESEFLFNPTVPTKAEHFLERKDVSFNDDSEANGFGIFDDFDAGSILDEEVEEGIDSFMGSIESNQGENSYRIGRLEEIMKNAWNGRFRLGLGLRSSLREHDDDKNWCKFPTVEFDQISPRIQTAAAAAAAADVGVVESSKSKTIVTTAEGDKKKKKKKKKKVTPAAESSGDPLPSLEQRVSPLLKLDYDGVLEAWSGKESPFSDEFLGSDAAGIDLHARLGEIDLFGESGMREASVLRYKEKRRIRLFSKKIRYQVSKLNADQRPRMKGRFVTRPNARNLSGIRV